ncbi:hypothetical protein WBG78_22490 [Chryseolinea sp. T2]|uniref:hypothetical protein n=1 Tax=Chryseolinea sp. T2 TaxID=3129255 RepID=UPI0030775267
MTYPKMKITPYCLFILALLALMFNGCDDEDSNPKPQRKSIAMSHGEFHYTILHYDDSDRIMRIVNGLIDDQSDSVEMIFYVIYNGPNIQRITAEDESQVFQYRYNDDRRMIETREYANGRVAFLHSFIYNEAGKVDAWMTKAIDGDNETPISRKFYTYDESGNATSMELENYDPVTRGYALVSNSQFLDFDNKKNSSSLFLNFINPYHVQFENNARVWRIQNANGSVGETKYEYEYNADGYTTSQRDIEGELEILYSFDLP